MSESLLAVIDPQDHRIRRQKVSPLFPTKATDMMAPKVLAVAQKAATCMAERGRQQRPMDMHRLCRSFSAEVLFKTLLGQSQDFIGSQEEHPELLKSIDAFLSHIWIIKSFPIISWLAINMPQSLAQRAVPGFKKFRDNCEKWAELSIDRQVSGKAPNCSDPLTNTLFDLILAPSTDYDPSPSTVPNLVDEAFMFVIAGTDSSGNTMANALYYILSSPSISSRLFKELQDNGITSQESFDCKLVQRLPYLTAVLKETMRIYTLAPGLFPRIVPDEGVTIGDHYIPAGTVISETIHSVHHNPSIFPSPSTFNPERWLNDHDKALEKFFVPYSKGSRACLGMNLANAEMYIILALLLSRFEMELYDTDARSVEWVDRGNAVNRSTVKVCVKRDRWAS
ncbi:hypothetical protein EYC80_003567 [Monilinia laxa]|uniref:Cytochrome P450 n=1 Tax=Monilinia laxa TaxID=61186 RepID=A0A5N6KKF7_MONLA|nr:hypothetical protein EYC80_003567 [Monilinia laxa]